MVSAYHNSNITNLIFSFQVNNNTQNMYVNVIEVFADGSILRHRLKVVELVSYFASPQDATSNFKRAVSCFRDLMIFLRHKKYPANHHGDPSAAGGEGQMGETAAGLPAILPRSGMGFYLIDLFQLKLICWGNRCLILDHDQSDNYNSAYANYNRASTVSSAVLVEVFVRDLRNNLQSLERRIQGSAPGLSWPRDVIRYFKITKIFKLIKNFFKIFGKLCLLWKELFH